MNVLNLHNTKKTLKRFYNEFKFKHPTPNDIKRTAERVSGANLDWYLTDWTQTLNTIDYGIKNVDGSKITLERIGQMPMPIDFEVIYTDGSKENFYIPLEMMRGEKPTTAKLLDDWAWTNPTYIFDTGKAVQNVIIDKSGLMADVNLENNTTLKKRDN